MAGDVNLYWNDYEEAGTAEIEVMVAERRSRRKGAAEEALRLLQAYAAAHLVRPGPRALEEEAQPTTVCSKAARGRRAARFGVGRLPSAAAGVAPPPQGVTKFRAKVGEANAPSLALFAKLGYAHVSRSEYFKEETLELEAGAAAAGGGGAALLLSAAAPLVTRPYDAPR